DRCDQPAPAWQCDGVGDCDGRAKHERCAEDKHPCEHDVRIGVSDPAEDRVLLEQVLEPTEIDAHCENQQQKRKCEGEPSPRQRDIASPTAECTGTTGYGDEEDGEETNDDGQRKQPAGE